MLNFVIVLFKNVKYFLIKFDYLIANSFYYLQCQFSEMMKDKIISKALFLSSKFKIVSGNEECEIIINYDKLANKNRGNSLAKYSSSYEFNEVPKVFNKIISNHQKDINKYLGKSFLFEKPICFRIFNHPQQFSNYDIFSNVWHQDSHDGNRFLKILVLIDDVNENDGPFHYLDEKNVRKNWKTLRERWTFEKFSKKPHYSDQITFTGKKYDYTILDSSRCMHRASNPQNYRDIIQIALYPRWRRKSDRKIFIHS